MVKLRAIVIAGVLVGGLLLIGGWLLWGRMVMSQPLHYMDPLGGNNYTLSGSATITQDFVARYPGLNGIDLYFGDSGGDSVALVFRLKEACTEELDLQTEVVEPADLAGRQPYPFVFPPIADSANRRFCLVLELAPGANLGYLNVYASPADTYPDGVATYQTGPSVADQGSAGNKAIAVSSSVGISTTTVTWLPYLQKNLVTVGDQLPDIGFQLHYDSPAWPAVLLLLGRLSAHKPFMFGYSSFYVFWLGLYLASLIAFCWTLLSQKRN